MTGLQDGAASFCILKVDMPQRNNQYEWSLSDSQGDFTDSVTLKHGCHYCVAELERKDGSLLTSLHHSGFYTMNKFRWSSKTYRYSFLSPSGIALIAAA